MQKRETERELQWRAPPFAAPDLMRASGVIKPLSIAGGLPAAYAPGDFKERCQSSAAAQAACTNGSCPGSLSSSGG